MAGYGAVVSLQQTIERILQSSRISLDPPSAEIIQIICRELESLGEILERLDDISPRKSRKKVNALDGRIKEAVWRFEDLLESHLSDQILSHQFERDSDRMLLFSTDQLRHDSGSFIETVKDMRNKYVHELDNMPQVEEDEDVNASTSSSSSLAGMKVRMVGFSALFEHLREFLMEEEEGGGKYLYTLVGMPGSGKTTLAHNVFEDPEIKKYFDHRVWLTLGRKYELNEIRRHILAQMDPHIDESITQGGDDKKHKHLSRVMRRYHRLRSVRDDENKIREYLRRGKRCLIVLDNVWDTEVCDHLMRTLFRVHSRKAMIKILLNTNYDNIALHDGELIESLVRGSGDTMRSLNEKESEELLRMKVFGEGVEDFPPHLKKAAKKIAKNCQGLPLMIVTVADLLSKANKNHDPEFWHEVAENRYSDVMMAAHNQISKVLFPVYDCSPQFSKLFYLFMGAFPQDSVIPASKLINMLTAEGFLKLQNLHEIFDSRWQFVHMISTAVVISREDSRMRSSVKSSVKSCLLNSSWCRFFNQESCKDKFLLLLDSGCVDSLEQRITDQRRLCLHANFVFYFKEMYSSVKCNCAYTLRSLLCFGPYYPYSMPLDVGFKLLRVLDALKVRFYTFPNEILELVLLQYLALTYNGELPTLISKLFSLQFLIIHPHLAIKSCGVQSYVPVQIWDMQELQHIEILGNNLPNHPNSASSLQKLSTLLGVSVHSCTKEVLERLPNIRKLGIQIELPPSGDDDLNFDYIGSLKNLEILKCSTIVNPEVKYECVTPQKPISMFPSSLRKLHLSGLGYPWEYMEVIGEIPNLQVLKLRCYAFQGSKWETKLNSFLQLTYLFVEDTDLVQWKPGFGSFPKLHTLRMKHCYKLQEISWPSDAHRGKIELVDCNPLAVACAKQLKSTKGLQVIASLDGHESLIVG